MTMSDNVTPINTWWVEDLTSGALLSDIGHFTVIYPLNGPILVAERNLRPDHYLYLSPNVSSTAVLKPMPGAKEKALICCISPSFVNHMTAFLRIPGTLNELLQNTALPKGDAMSSLLQDLALETNLSLGEDLFMEVVGEILKIQRARYAVVTSLADRKSATQTDLLKRLINARQFIEANFLKSLTPKMVAEYVAISEYHFSRLFKAAFELTVYQYLLHLRLNYARQKLECSEARITDIALDIGYNSVSAFNTAFKKSFAMSPSAWQSKFSAVKK